MRPEHPDVWVVYRIAPTKHAAERTIICTQVEWDVMQREHPGHNTLVRDQIIGEPEAERLVRSLQPVDATKKK